MTPSPEPSAVARPRVSVVLATFDGERFLGEQLASIAGQTRQPDEVVVVDDASRDGTVALLESFRSSSASGVRLITRSEHLGTSATFEEAMRATNGDLIVICDQDDVWRPDKVQVLVAAMDAHPDAYLGFSDSRLIDSQGDLINPSRWTIAGFGDRQRGAMERDPFGQMLARQIVSGCTSIIRSGLLPALLPFPANLHPTWPAMIYDRWMSLLAAAAGPILMVQEQLVDYRIHPRQQVGIPRLSYRRVAPKTVLRVGQLVPPRAEMADRIKFHLAHVNEIEKRLAVSGLGTPDHEALLARAEEHLRSRLSLPARRRERGRDVLAEYRDPDGYRRFSLGATTALADLLR